MIIDSHFHPLSMAKRGITELPEDIIGIAVATEPGETERMTVMLPQDRRIFISAGAGPWVLNEELFISPEDEIEKIRKEIAEYPADAIGECGFDNHWKYGDRKSAMELFMMQAALAELVIEGVQTNAELSSDILARPEFKDGSYCTNFLDKFLKDYK